jgi:hypothetical protein
MTVTILVSKRGYFKEIVPIWDNEYIIGYNIKDKIYHGNWVKCTKGYIIKNTNEHSYEIYINKKFKEFNPYMYGFNKNFKDIIGDVILIKRNLKTSKPNEFNINELIYMYNIYRPIIKINSDGYKTEVKKILLKYFYYPNEEKKFKSKPINNYFKEKCKVYLIKKSKGWIIFKHKTKSLKYFLSY